MNKLTAKNTKNQAKVNRAVKRLTMHNHLNDLRDEIEGEFGEDCARWRAIDRKCANAFDKYLEACEELPQYEVKRIETSELY